MVVLSAGNKPSSMTHFQWRRKRAQHFGNDGLNRRHKDFLSQICSDSQRTLEYETKHKKI